MCFVSEETEHVEERVVDWESGQVGEGVVGLAKAAGEGLVRGF